MGEDRPTIPQDVAELAGAGGWKAAVDQAIEQQLAAYVGGQAQPELFDLQAEDGAEPGDIARGVGRPRGSVNRKTLDIARVLERYGDPVQFLGRMYGTPLPILLRQLGLAVSPNADPATLAIALAQAFNVFKLQAWCAKEAAPYAHSKMPLKISTDGEGPSVVINFVAPETAARLSNADPADRLKIIGEQGLSEFEPPPFDARPLDNPAHVTDIVEQSAASPSDRQADGQPALARGTDEDAAHASRAAPPTPQAAELDGAAPVAHGIFPRDGQRPTERAEIEGSTIGAGGAEPSPEQATGQGNFFDVDREEP